LSATHSASAAPFGNSDVEDTHMTKMFTALAVLAFLAGSASFAHAQSAIAGVVKDATGGVLPGVTVEASSAALIEKARSAVTDGSGQYRIVDLRPGVYAVTFTLPGFSTIRREGIELVAGFTAPINVTLNPGEVQETLTVTGETPVVDIHNTREQTVLTRNQLDSIPNSRNVFHQATLIPGVQSDRLDIGGTQGHQEATVRVHGSQSADQNFKIDGMSVNSPFGDGRTMGVYLNDGMFEEVSFQTSALPAEMAQGGIAFNMVLRDGGNQYRGFGYFGGSTSGMQSDNLTDDLRERGLSEAAELIKLYDANISFGGPIVRDRLWFFGSHRYQRFDQYEAGLNPDGSRPLDDNKIGDWMGRLTLQVNARNKLTAFYENNDKSRGGRRDRSADFQFIESRAAILQTTPLSYTGGFKWTSTLSDRLLFDSGVSFIYISSSRGVQREVLPTDLPTIDFVQSTLTTAWTNNLLNRSFMARLNSSLSYISGAHNIKAGVQFGRGSYTVAQTVNEGMHLRFRNGVADSVDLWNSPTDAHQDVDRELGLYLQDSWTLGRLTLNPGVRYDRYIVNIPPQAAGAGPWVPAREFPEMRDLPNWTDVVPRFGAAYDLLGDGRTVVKGSASKYMQNEGTNRAQAVNPMLLQRDRRAWTDSNGDRTAQLSELGPSTGFAGGVTSRIDPELTRPYNWEFTAGIDHELLPGFSVGGTYYRRLLRNLIGSLNMAVLPDDYTPVTITNPLTNQPLTVYNQSAATVGLRDTVVTNQGTLDSTYNGLEVRTNARLRSRGIVAGGVTYGRIVSGSGDTNNPNTLINFLGVDSSVQIKLYGAQPLPWDMQISGSVQSFSGAPLARNFTVTRAQVPNLNQVTQVVSLVPRGEEQLERVNIADIRFSKALRWGPRKVEFQFDLYNMLNENAVTSEVQTVGPALGQPVSIVGARLMRLGVNVNF
jgi:Carboxypeptidase regulatory-like domain